MVNGPKLETTIQTLKRIIDEFVAAIKKWWKNFCRCMQQCISELSKLCRFQHHQESFHSLPFRKYTMITVPVMHRSFSKKIPFSQMTYKSSVSMKTIRRYNRHR